MVAVIIIAVVFTGLAAILFWAAPRGKLAPLANVLYSQKRAASMTINVTLAVVMIGFGLVVPAIFLVGNHDRSMTGGTGGVKLTANEVNGRELFGEHCAVCHTLASASAVGKVGPNLDQLKPAYQTIMHTIENGCLQQPASASEVSEACLGYGSMPADIVQGQDAVNVARYVAAVAGKS
jgi:cytochrome c5